MRTLIAVVASLAVNGALIGGLAYSAIQLHVPPLGEVLIVQLPEQPGLPAYADARAVGPSAARAL